MRKLLLLFSIFILLFVANTDGINDSSTFFKEVKKGIAQVKERVDLDSVKNSMNQLLERIGISVDSEVEKKEEKIPGQSATPPSLEKPRIQSFAVRNFELGDSKSEVEKEVGEPKRISLNEYGVNWHTYHDQYRHFFMAAYDGETIVGLYTNHPLFTSSIGIEAGTTKRDVQSRLGKPLEEIQKGLVIYKLPKDRDYDLYRIDGNYITLFYDRYEKDTVRAIQIISGKLEKAKPDLYAVGNVPLMEGFEYQLFDLTNAERVKYGLEPLTWDEQVRLTARKHSKDMAKNDYFSHTNVKGESPFDRMKADHISFVIAGENLAYGQFSSIFAHEGLMNSEGHRKNILLKDYVYTGVGVAFNEEEHPYFTQNFFAR